MFVRPNNICISLHSMIALRGFFFFFAQPCALIIFCVAAKICRLWYPRQQMDGVAGANGADTFEVGL
jgi:hypothetical protein